MFLLLCLNAVCALLVTYWSMYSNSICEYAFVWIQLTFVNRSGGLFDAVMDRLSDTDDKSFGVLGGTEET